MRTLPSLPAAAWAVPVSAGPWVVLVPEARLGALLARLRADRPLAARVAGVLAAPGAPPADPDTPGTHPAVSLAARFPLAELAPYEPGDWAWNPGGAGLLRAPLPAPVALLDDAAAGDARRRAAANARQARSRRPHSLHAAVLFVGLTSQLNMAICPLARHAAASPPAASGCGVPYSQQRCWESAEVCMQGGAGAQHVAELRAPMAADGNSSQCIAARTCLPLGAHSVWAALPPLPADADADARPLLLVLAGVDGDGLFHDQIRVRRTSTARHPHLPTAATWLRGCSAGPPQLALSEHGDRSVKVVGMAGVGRGGASVWAGGDAGGGRGAGQRERGGQLRAARGLCRAGGRALGSHGLAAPAVADARGQPVRARPAPGRCGAGARCRRACVKTHVSCFSWCSFLRRYSCRQEALLSMCI